jgi:SAM-dependent MidA family methyltransferase
MEEVERLIRDEAQREGSISFARFMERALLEPGLGYYATAQRRAGRSGDFMTAPELHPILVPPSCN